MATPIQNEDALEDIILQSGGQLQPKPKTRPAKNNEPAKPTTPVQDKKPIAEAQKTEQVKQPIKSETLDDIVIPKTETKTETKVTPKVEPKIQINHPKPNNPQQSNNLQKSNSPQKRRTRLLAIVLLLIVGGLIRWILSKGEPKNPGNTTNTGDQNTGIINIVDKNKDRENLDERYRFNKKDGGVYFQDFKIEGADKATFVALGNQYAKDANSVYCQGKAMANINPAYFYVLKNGENYEMSGLFVTSKNLLEYLQIKSHREFLMTSIGDLAKANGNVKSELTSSSVYAMDGFKNEYSHLNTLKRKGNLTDLERAKFGILFLYIKLIKDLESDKIKMSVAKEELKYFLDHSDEILKQYSPETIKPTELNGNIGYDKYCVYKDGSLVGCFLEKIFIDKID